jgi:hypothetical protein
MLIIFMPINHIYRGVQGKLLNISRIFLKYGDFSYDGVNDQHMFTKQRFIAYCCNFILPPEASCLTVPDIQPRDRPQIKHSLNGLQQSMHCCTVSSGYSVTFFAASKQRNSNSVQGIFMYEKFNRNSTHSCVHN